MAWLVFMVWTGIACSLGWKHESGEEIATILGMPRWVFFGVILPWLAACGFTGWFSMCYMKDTDLDPDRDRAELESEPDE